MQGPLDQNNILGLRNDLYKGLQAVLEPEVVLEAHKRLQQLPDHLVDLLFGLLFEDALQDLEDQGGQLAVHEV